MVKNKQKKNILCFSIPFNYTNKLFFSSFILQITAQYKNKGGQPLTKGKSPILAKKRHSPGWDISQQRMSGSQRRPSVRRGRCAAPRSSARLCCYSFHPRCCWWRGGCGGISPSRCWHDWGSRAGWQQTEGKRRKTKLKGFSLIIFDLWFSTCSFYVKSF